MTLLSKFMEKDFLYVCELKEKKSSWLTKILGKCVISWSTEETNCHRALNYCSGTNDLLYFLGRHLTSLGLLFYLESSTISSLFPPDAVMKNLKRTLDT